MKIICIGLNYKDHTKEFKSEIPSEPVFFLKPDTALLRNNNPFFIPDFSKNVHYEVEIILKINRLGRSIEENFANRYFDEIGVGIDFTARDLQDICREKGHPWEISKAFDNAAAVGKFISKSQFKDLTNLQFRLDINGKTVQNGNTCNMIFNFEKIISYVSKYISFRIGDLIFTGTPSGVGAVKIGDRLQAYIEDKCLLDFLIK
jgi:acylpyruvate hydrolase